MSEQRALENLTVLDLTRVLAGPFCTMMMADMGARVIKIEMPVTGDDTRAYPPFRENCEGKRESLYFANINRNKSGLTLNLKSEEGKKIFRQLVKEAGHRADHGGVEIGEDPVALRWDAVDQGHVAGQGHAGHHRPPLHPAGALLQEAEGPGLPAGGQAVRPHPVREN